jgi:hypothetical protein
MEKQREELVKRGDVSALRWLLRSQIAQASQQGSGEEREVLTNNLEGGGDPKWKDSGW